MEHTGDFDLSALDIQLPHLGEIVTTYRQKYTRDGAEGMPPHVTLLYPFLNMDEYTRHANTLLAEVIALFPPFMLHIGELFRFPGVLYLEVSPKQHILNMIQRLVQEFPRFLPYGGKIPVHELTPHVTIAIDASEEHLDLIAQACRHELQRVTFAPVMVDRLSFSVRTSGQWRQLSSFHCQGSTRK